MARLDEVSRRELLKRVGWVVPVVLTVGLSTKAFADYGPPQCTENCAPPS